MARFAVVGSGAWGTALAAHLARLEHEVMLWAFEREVAEEICSAHINSAFLPGLALPQTIGASHDMATAVSGAEIVILVPPSTHLRAVSSVLAPVLPRDAIVVIATKGIEEESLRLMSQVVAETMPAVGPERLAFLSGPTFAREVGQGLPTDVVVASTDMVAARRLQSLVHSVSLRVYTSADPIGVQVGGAIKNVMAIATGASDGLAFGNNARAALITRGLVEITRLGVTMGAKAETFAGLAGLGDLITTCVSPEGRNRSVGEQIGKGRTLEQVLEKMDSVAEGVPTTRSVMQLARKYNVEMPITEAVHAILFDEKDVLDALADLMTRDPKPEA